MVVVVIIIIAVVIGVIVVDVDVVIDDNVGDGDDIIDDNDAVFSILQMTQGTGRGAGQRLFVVRLTYVVTEWK